jgi:diguanylate cyclase (GGDEF)-like protein
VAVILLDLARFRLVNEALGPASGDQLLRLVAQQLTDAVETGDTLARVGGDEFGLIAEHCESLQAVTLRAEALLNACAKPQTIGGTTWTIEACVGIAVYPLDGDLWQTLIRHATVALKRAKARGPRTLQYFAPGMAQDVQKRLQLEAGLRRARVDGELWLAFQPQVRLSDGQIAGAEALLRWQSRRLGAISPTQFISLAEEIGLIGELGLWVIEKGCEQLARWEHLGFYVPRLAVNVSILQIEGDGLLDAVIAILTRTGIKPCRLELEITESMIMRRAEQTINQLRALRDLGLTIAIDDFGTGYSSLAYLRRLPLHQLKIDKSFIDDLPADTNSQAVARAVIGLGQSLGLETLAEGVENAAQAAWLKQAGCDLVQGYLYDRPRPAAEFAAGCRMASGPGIALRGDG